jgi:hypothetical protein
MPRNGSPPPRGSFVYEHMTPELQAYLDLIQDRPDIRVDPEAYRAWRAEAVQALSLVQDEHHAYVDALLAAMEAVHTPPDTPRLEGAWTCEIETSSEVVGLPDDGDCSQKSEVK